MSEYPDHLNPFKEGEKKKLGRTLTKSYREFKGFIRQSFRKKKSKSRRYDEFEDVEIRKPQNATSYSTPRNVMSMPSPPTYSSFTITSPPLPRSRFKERLSRSSLSNTYNSSYDERCNPFAEEGTNPFDNPPIPYRRKKSKQRAPLPPSFSNPNVNLGCKERDSSKWSLTSSETDYTIDDKSEYSGDMTYSQSLRDCLDNFNKEMDTLTKESLQIGGSSPNILEGTRSEEEPEYIKKSNLSIDSIDIEITQEINNNTNEGLSDVETIPEIFEITTPNIIVSEETFVKERDIEEIREIPVELNIKESQLEVENNSESMETYETKQELTCANTVEELKEDYKINTGEKNLGRKYEINDNVEKNDSISENIEVRDKKETIYSELENIPEETEKDRDEDEIELEQVFISEKRLLYSVTTEENHLDNNMTQEFCPDKIEMKYIDEDISVCRNQEQYELEINQSNGNCPIENTKFQNLSPIPKQRKYKLDKGLLLGEESVPK